MSRRVYFRRPRGRILLRRKSIMISDTKTKGTFVETMSDRISNQTVNIVFWNYFSCSNLTKHKHNFIRYIFHKTAAWSFIYKGCALKEILQIHNFGILRIIEENLAFTSSEETESCALSFFDSFFVHFLGLKTRAFLLNPENKTFLP